MTFVRSMKSQSKRSKRPKYSSRWRRNKVENSRLRNLTSIRKETSLKNYSSSALKRQGKRSDAERPLPSLRKLIMDLSRIKASNSQSRMSNSRLQISARSLSYFLQTKMFFSSSTRNYSQERYLPVMWSISHTCQELVSKTVIISITKVAWVRQGRKLLRWWVVVESTTRGLWPRVRSISVVLLQATQSSSEKCPRAVSRTQILYLRELIPTWVWTWGTTLPSQDRPLSSCKTGCTVAWLPVSSRCSLTRLISTRWGTCQPMTVVLLHTCESTTTCSHRERIREGRSPPAIVMRMPLTSTALPI